MRNMERFTPDPRESREGAEEVEIDVIERSLLDSDKKLDLVLLSLDRKRAAILGNCKIAETEHEKEEVIRDFTEELKEIKKTLTELGYHYHEDGVKVEDEVIVSFSVVVSKKEEYLSQVMNAEKQANNKEVGLLLGYPATAVDSYNSEKALDSERFFQIDLPEDERKQLEDEGVLRFLGFQPSKEHWREELEEVRENQSLIKEKAPHLYAEIMEPDDEI